MTPSHHHSQPVKEAVREAARARREKPPGGHDQRRLERSAERRPGRRDPGAPDGAAHARKRQRTRHPPQCRDARRPASAAQAALRSDEPPDQSGHQCPDRAVSGPGGSVVRTAKNRHRRNPQTQVGPAKRVRPPPGDPETVSVSGLRLSGDGLPEGQGKPARAPIRGARGAPRPQFWGGPERPHMFFSAPQNCKALLAWAFRRPSP